MLGNFKGQEMSFLLVEKHITKENIKDARNL